MASEVVALAKKLIQLATSHPNFENKRACLELIKKEIGESLHVQEFEFSGFPSLLLSNTPGVHFDLLLAGHIDVVSGPPSLFEPIEKDGKLFGRGAYDMKGSVAAMVRVLQGYARQKIENGKQKNVGLLLTSDEEIDGQNGTKAMLEKTGLTADFALLPDNGQNWEIVIAERGLVHAQIPSEAKEKITAALAAHFPQRGNENQDWITTFAVEDRFPDKADIRVRFVNSEDRQAALTLLKQPAFQVIRQHGGFATPGNNPHLQKLSKLIQAHVGAPPSFAKECRTNESDGIYFGERNIPVALVRPLGGGMHQDGEWLDLAALESFSKILQSFLDEHQA